MKLKIEHHISYWQTEQDMGFGPRADVGPQVLFKVFRWTQDEKEDGYWAQIGHFDSEDNANIFVHQFKLQYQPDKIIEF
jgi:hypothetical protein